MALGYRLDLKQSQQLVMTPQLQQAIKLLQMSNLELREFVERELETNPLIRVEGAEDIRPGDTPQLVGKSRETGETPLDAQLTPEGNHDLGAETFDHGAENLYDTGAAEFATRPAVAAGGRHDFEATAFDLEQEPDHPVSLRDHLLAQIGLSRAEPQTVALARLLVEELDEHGYLRADLAELAERFGALPEQIDAALALVQGCEPTGVGARDVAECLALQLAEHDRLDPAMKRLLANLTHLERGDRRRLRAICEVDEDDLVDMLAELRALDPRPCARFQIDRAETLIPDVLLRRVPSNGQAGGHGSGWQLELNPDTLPRVLVDNRYAARLAPARGAAAKEARSFLSNCRANANWLVRSLDQRARTILTVAMEIVRQQEGFFTEGISGLKPLTLAMVAEATGLHESTASRVTANKYIATERGIFELKFFFSNAVGAEGLTATAVRQRIRAIVDAEKPDQILSDDTIVEKLQEDGIDIARRTVAKYRKSLGIRSSVERRREKSMMPEV